MTSSSRHDFLGESASEPTKWDYVAVWVLLALSGNLYIVSGPYNHAFLYAGFLFSILYYCRGHARGGHVLLYLVAWLAFLGIQSLFSEYFSYNTICYYILNISSGCFILAGLGMKFKEVYFKIIFYLSATSLIFFFLNSIGIWIPPFFNGGDRNSIIIYTQLQNFFTGGESVRNSSMFWEPGAFQGYLLLAFLPYLNCLYELYQKKKRMIQVILLALVTTFSTTGYLMAFILVFIYFLMYRRSDMRTVFASLIVLGIFIYSIFSFDFMGGKLGIEESGQGGVYFGGNRMRNVVNALPVVLDHWCWGMGYSSEGVNHLAGRQIGEDIVGFSNGFIAHVFYTGVMGTIFYFVFLICNFLRQGYRPRDILCVLIFVVIELQGECFLNLPLFLALPVIMFRPYEQRLCNIYSNMTK